eukprot:Pgem_evm1s18975
MKFKGAAAIIRHSTFRDNFGNCEKNSDYQLKHNQKSNPQLIPDFQEYCLNYDGDYTLEET